MHQQYITDNFPRNTQLQRVEWLVWRTAKTIWIARPSEK